MPAPKTTTTILREKMRDLVAYILYQGILERLDLKQNKDGLEKTDPR